MYDRFSSREDPDPELFRYDPNVDTLPDPEDLIDNKGLYYFIGYYCHAMMEYHRLSQATNIATLNGQVIWTSALKRESDIEQWLDRALDWLPEWAQQLTPQNT